MDKIENLQVGAFIVMRNAFPFHGIQCMNAKESPETNKEEYDRSCKRGSGLHLTPRIGDSVPAMFYELNEEIQIFIILNTFGTIKSVDSRHVH